MPAVPRPGVSLGCCLSGGSVPSAQRPIINLEGICDFVVMVVEQSSFCFASLGD